MQTVFQKYVSSNSYLDIVIFTLLTAFSIYNGQSTIFYVIYFFWWNELLHIIIDLYFSRSVKKEKLPGEQTFGPFFLMFIYGVFILIFFGLIANWDNQDLILINLEVLLFKNWFFNLNLIFVLVKRIYLNRKQLIEKATFGAFTNNMIILHISIILGGLMMFFVVKRFPNFFSPENLLGSVIIIAPFLLLKVLFAYVFRKKKTKPTIS